MYYSVGITDRTDENEEVISSSWREHITETAFVPIRISIGNTSTSAKKD